MYIVILPIKLNWSPGCKTYTAIDALVFMGAGYKLKLMTSQETIPLFNDYYVITS